MNNYIDSENKIYKKNSFSFFGIVIVALLIIGGTYAIVNGINISNGSYATETTCFNIDYDVTNDDGTLPISGVLFPSSSYSGGLAGNVSLKINNLCSIEGIGKLNLNVVSASNILTQVVDGHCENKNTLETVSKYTTEDACIAKEENIWVTTGTALKYAVFDTTNELPVSVGYVDRIGSIEILNNIILSKTASVFNIYIWLDGNLSDNSYANLDFNANISGSVEQIEGDLMVNFDTNGGGFESIEYNTVGEHTYTIPFDGEYQLEVWGAQGGNFSTDIIGGYGGYSSGIIYLEGKENLYVNVGGTTTSTTGGYNGGGNGGSSSGLGGGGATHISKVSGELSTLDAYIGLLYDTGLTYNSSKILIVAGGGGGADNWSTGAKGGYAGGYIGVPGTWTNSTSMTWSLGGSQLTGGVAQTSGAKYHSKSGEFGLGGAGASWGGGGGGGFYGGSGGNSASDWVAGGGGGSGYIGNSMLSDKYMYCYKCETSDDENTLTYSTTNVSEEPLSDYAKSGNGAARITFLTSAKNVTYNKKYGELPIPTKYGYTFVGWNTKSDGSGQFVTSDTTVVFFGEQTLYAVWKFNNPVESYICANGSAGSSPYLINYSGNCTVIDDGNDNWRIKFLSEGSHTLTVSENIFIDVFLVGGGGGGAGGLENYYSGGGGGGGYAKTVKGVNLTSSNTYSIQIGNGGSASGGTGGNTSAFGYSVSGGNGGSGSSGGTGGNNGGNGGSGYNSGSNGGSGNIDTREFGESSGSLYSGGGGGGGGGGGASIGFHPGGSGGGGGGGVGGDSTIYNGGAGVTNTGGGGGGGTEFYGYGNTGSAGGSGIVIIRNSRD